MVKAVYDTIQKIKPYVTFGMSPAGVSASSQAVADKYGVDRCTYGSDWQYNGIYADPLAWLSEGSIDYISPQLYWGFAHPTNSYGGLCPWWSKVANKFGKHFYPSSNVNISGLANHPPEVEIGKQMECNRSNDLNGAPGYVYFSVGNFFSPYPVDLYLKANQFQNKALPPAIDWKPAPEQGIVDNLVLDDSLRWTYGKDSLRYTVYAAPKDNTNPLTTAPFLQGISYEKQFALPTGVSEATHRIAVSVLDRYGNEFAPRVLGESPATSAATTLIAPADNATVSRPVTFSWKPVEGASAYIWEISPEPDFSKMLSSQELNDTQFQYSFQIYMKDYDSYYWRVKTLVANGGDAWSEVRKVTICMGLCDDGNPPAIVSYDPKNEQEESARPIVRIEFNEPLNESSLTGKITVKDKNGNSVSGVQNYYAAANGKSVMHYIFNADLKPQESYTVTLFSGVKDKAGNAMPEGLTFTFTTKPREILANIMLEDFKSLTTPVDWRNASQIGGLLIPPSIAAIDGSMRPTKESTGSLNMTYQWESGVTVGEWRFHAYTANTSLPNFTKSSDSYIQFYLFGDGNGTRFSPVLQRVSTSPTTYYSKPIAMNWTGWKLITWDLNNTEGLSHPWLGGSDEVPAGVALCLKSVHTQTAELLDVLSGKFWVSQVQAVRLGDFIPPPGTGIKEISVEKASVSAYYDLLGRKLPKEPANGIYIILYDNGTAKKVMK